MVFGVLVQCDLQLTTSSASEPRYCSQLQRKAQVQFEHWTKKHTALHCSTQMLKNSFNYQLLQRISELSAEYKSNLQTTII